MTRNRVGWRIACPPIPLRWSTKKIADAFLIALSSPEFTGFVDRLTDASSRTISLRSLMLGRRSPGAVFRLDEASMHVLLDRLCSRLKGFSMRDDGTGGVDLIFNDRAAPHARLERFAWH